MRGLKPSAYKINQSLYFYILYIAGFPNGVDWLVDNFGKIDQEMQENCKISIFGSKQWGYIVGQTSFCGSGWDLLTPPHPPSPLGETLYGLGIINIITFCHFLRYKRLLYKNLNEFFFQIFLDATAILFLLIDFFSTAVFILMSKCL